MVAGAPSLYNRRVEAGAEGGAAGTFNLELVDDTMRPV